MYIRLDLKNPIRQADAEGFAHWLLYMIHESDYSKDVVAVSLQDVKVEFGKP